MNATFTWVPGAQVNNTDDLSCFQKGECEASPVNRLSSSLRGFGELTVQRRENAAGLIVGAGCQLKRLLSHVGAFGDYHIIYLLPVYVRACAHSITRCGGQRTNDRSSFLPPYGFWGSNSDSQTRREAPLPAEPPHCPRTILITSAEMKAYWLEPAPCLLGSWTIRMGVGTEERHPSAFSAA